jgi:SAM-dependent methyltransferase
MNERKIRKAVRESYAKVAKRERTVLSPLKSCCCSEEPEEEIGRKIGYSEEEMGQVPEGSNLGLGCGNPVALASLRKGEIVLDLGSGAGLDCFLAAKRVGRKGKVIGVDMTPEMLEKARENAEKSGFENVEFRLGEIENLPVADGSVDIIISNCVINLSTDKKRVFDEALRVLRPGGRLMISDLVLLKPLPKSIKKSIEAYVGCIAGAMLKRDYLATIKAAGFERVEVVQEDSFALEAVSNDPIAKEMAASIDLPKEKVMEMARTVVSVKVSAWKRR